MAQAVKNLHLEDYVDEDVNLDEDGDVDEDEDVDDAWGEEEDDVDTIINNNYIQYLNAKEKNRRQKMLQRTALQANMNESVNKTLERWRASTWVNKNRDKKDGFRPMSAFPNSTQNEAEKASMENKKPQWQYGSMILKWKKTESWKPKPAHQTSSELIYGQSQLWGWNLKKRNVTSALPPQSQNAHKWVKFSSSNTGNKW